MSTGSGARKTCIAAATLAAGAGVLAGLPMTSGAVAPRVELDAEVADLVHVVDDAVRRVVTPARPQAAAAPAARPAPARRVVAQDPATEPPLHGTNPHGQGSVAVVDIQPSPDRPTGDDPVGSNSDEEVVVGRAKGEQRPDGTYHGHITIAALFGNEILGVDTGPGQTAAGPLDPIQTGVLDAICNGSGNNLCVSVLRADSATTNNGSVNRFSVANAAVGGPGGIAVGAAESSGSAGSDGSCQTTRGESSVANVNAGGGAVAGVAKSSTESKACKGQAPQQTNQSSVLELGGTGVPIPAAGCADGTPDTVTGIPTLAPIICNADENGGAQAAAPYGVREALTVFALATGPSALIKTTTAASESRAQAPPAQCSDRVDNDGDGVSDAADPGCHTDGNAGNPSSYAPNDDDETNAAAAGGPPADEGKPTTGAGRPDARDDDDGPEGAGSTQCADGRDNDGDGRIDAADPGCHTDGDAGNPSSYDPGDDSEADPRGAVRGARDEGALARTGSDILGLALAGLVLVAAGLGLRRPLGAR